MRNSAIVKKLIKRALLSLIQTILLLQFTDNLCMLLALQGG